jgi:hypothetical protein
VFKLIIDSDDEMRKLIREEVKGALIAMSREEMQKQVDEGIRRAMGPGVTTMDALVLKSLDKTLALHVSRQLGSFSVVEAAREAIRTTVAQTLNKVASAQVGLAMAKIDVEAVVRKAFGNITISAKVEEKP